MWYTNLFLCLEQWRYPQQKQQWIKNGENLKRFRRGTWRKSEVYQRWSMKQGRRAKKFILPHWWRSVIRRMPDWRQSTKNTKVEFVLRGDIVKDDSGSYAVFTNQGSSASQMTAAKVMDIISRLPGKGTTNVLNHIDSVPSNVQSSDQDDHKGKEVPQWDMFPEPTELRLIGCSIESIWTLKSKSNTLTPKTNLQTCWPREITHVMNGIIFCVCLTLAISVLQSVLKWCRKEHKKIQVRNASQQNRNQWWIWSRDAA